MRKVLVAVCIIFSLMMHISLFAGGNHDNPAKHNVYGYLGSTVKTDTEASDFALGAGYEGAVSKNISLGAYLGMETGTGIGVKLLMKPRYYINPALENFFIGANLGVFFYEEVSSGSYIYDYYYNDYYYEEGQSSSTTGFLAGLNIGYKFVFGNNSAGFSLEPSIGYDFLPGSINIGVALGFAWGGGGTPKAAPAPAPVRGVQDGIYVGIITFGAEAIDITNGPILLDNAGYKRLEDLLRDRYRREPQNRPGTALFYANHLALANMKNAESRLPRELESVSLISFTDGIDNQSTLTFLPDIIDQGSAARRFTNMTEYMDYVNNEHKIRRIRSKPIEAYSIGVMGRDVPVNDRTRFINSLNKLATTEGEPHQNFLTEIGRVQTAFTNIANRIVQRWSVTNFQMVSPGFPPGTKLRMTFNNEMDHDGAMRASRYLEGTVSLRGRDYFLTDIRYQGITSSSGREVKGTVRPGEMRIIYNFNNITNYNPRTEGNNVRQFFWNEDGKSWQRNSEYFGDGDSSSHVTKNNALIYLVLDQSNSLSDDEVRDIRAAVFGFITELYQKYNQ